MGLGTRASQKLIDHQLRTKSYLQSLRSWFCTVSVSERWWHWGWYKPTQLSIEELIAGFRNVLMLHALSLFRQKPSCDRKMHNLIPYRPCLWSDAQGSALPRAGPVRSLLLVPQRSRMREVWTNQPAQARVVIAKEGGKSGKQKSGFFNSSRSRIKLGTTSHSACGRSVQTENLYRTGCTYKTPKNQLQITKRQLPKLKRTLHKPKILCLAWLPRFSAGRTGKSVPFALPRLSQAQEGEPGKGSKLCPLLICWDPQAALRRNVPQADSAHRLSDVLCCHRAPGVSVPCPSPHTLGSSSVSPGTFWNSSSAFSENLLTGLTLGSLLTPLYFPKPRNNLCLLCLTRNSRSQIAPPTLESPFLSDTAVQQSHTATSLHGMSLKPLPNHPSHVLIPNQLLGSLQSHRTPRYTQRQLQVVPVSDNLRSKGQDLSTCTPEKDPLLLRGKVRKDLGSSSKPTAQHHPCHVITSRTFSENSQNFYKDYAQTLLLTLIKFPNFKGSLNFNSAAPIWDVLQGPVETLETRPVCSILSRINWNSYWNFKAAWKNNSNL